jgi:hypothetical protein
MRGDLTKLDPELILAESDPTPAALKAETERQTKAYQAPSLPSRIVGTDRIWTVGTSEYRRSARESYPSDGA